MVVLVPVDDKEFNVFLEKAVKNYAAEKVKARTWPEAGSFQRSDQEFKNLLPDGKDTINNHIFKIVDADKAVEVGTLWIAVGRKGDLPEAFIYDIVVNDEYRGKGYGKAAMHELEKVVKNLGYDRISLHVFGHNKIAISLYESCGFEVTDINMSKTM